MNEYENHFMKEAIRLAAQAEAEDEVPVGCVIVKNGEILASAYNTRQQSQISTHHAEILAIEKACQTLGSWRLEDCDLFVTLEPCPMCTGAIIQSRIKNVYFGASDFKGGCMGSLIDLTKVSGFNHYPNVQGGILKEECAQQLSSYFKKKREKKKSAKNKPTV